jgi:hypothetical protein
VWQEEMKGSGSVAYTDDFESADSLLSASGLGDSDLERRRLMVEHAVADQKQKVHKLQRDRKVGY